MFDESRVNKGIDAFEKIYSIDTEAVDKSGWADSEWLAYQNINLIKDINGKLYLIGLGQNNEEENRADLFLVEHKDFAEFTLKKLMSRSFNCRGGANFRSAAGIHHHPDGRLKVISCGSHIRDTLVLNIFE